MGPVQRIFYIHVAVAWLGLLGFAVMGVCCHALPFPPQPGLGPLVTGGKRSGLALQQFDLIYRLDLGSCGMGILVDMGSPPDHIAAVMGTLLELPDPPRQHPGASPERPHHQFAGISRSDRSASGHHGDTLVSRHPPQCRQRWNRHAPHAAAEPDWFHAVFRSVVPQRRGQLRTESLLRKLELQTAANSPFDEPFPLARSINELICHYLCCLLAGGGTLRQSDSEFGNANFMIGSWPCSPSCIFPRGEQMEWQCLLAQESSIDADCIGCRAAAADALLAAGPSSRSASGQACTRSIPAVAASRRRRQAGGPRCPAIRTFRTMAQACRQVRADSGTIRGLVVNGSREQLGGGWDRSCHAGQAAGAIRRRQNGHNRCARPDFNLTIYLWMPDIQYVPGASRGEIHYPGPRLTLTEENPDAQVRIVVYEQSTGPNPLVMEQHDIFVRPRTAALEVTESMVISNPAKMSYVGQPDQGAIGPSTLQLAIPSNFERVTFAKEFYGRRFSLVNGKLMTDIPWPPGKRRLKFTYVLPKEKGPVLWQRPIDLPCSLVRLTVLTDKPGEVRCDLEAERSATDHQVTFTTAGPALPAGREIHLQHGPIGRALMVYGRWAALTFLGLLIGGTGAGLLRSRG